LCKYNIELYQAQLDINTTIIKKVSGRGLF
jgi:hypothetical protein